MWQLTGILVISVAGSLLHFAFEWSGRLLPVALIAAVNESVWEHLKLAFWPSIIFTALEYQFIREYVKNFLTAVTAGLCLTPIVIISVFYSYTSLIGRSILTIDISTFVVAIALGQLTAYLIMRQKELPDIIKNVSLAALATLILAFLLFTYYPPQYPLFQDSRNGEYGIAAGAIVE